MGRAPEAREGRNSIATFHIWSETPSDRISTTIDLEGIRAGLWGDPARRWPAQLAGLGEIVEGIALRYVAVKSLRSYVVLDAVDSRSSQVHC